MDQFEDNQDSISEEVDPSSEGNFREYSDDEDEQPIEQERDDEVDD